MAVRIEGITFSPWGCFENLTLDFSGSSADAVQLIDGPNAAGKSTASRGERGLLYGIPQRTPDAHTFPYPDLRIGGHLMLNGKAVEVVRRKGLTRTLLNPEGDPLDDDLIARALGGLSEGIYEALFQITHETLVQGGEELLQGRGELGASLFAAAAGIAALHDTVDSLDAEAGRIFNPRARKDPLHVAIGDLTAAQKRLRQTTLRPTQHREMERDLRLAEEACNSISREVHGLERESRSLERKKAIAPLVERHCELAEELETVAGVPELAEDAAERRARGVSAREGATQRLEGAGARVKELNEEIAAIEVDEDLLARADEVRGAHEGISATRKAAEDRRKREGEVVAAEASLADAAAKIGIEPGEIEHLRRPATARLALDRCLREHGELVERGRAARSRVNEATNQVEADEATLADAPDAADTGPLPGALRAAGKLGPIEAQAAEAESEAERLKVEAEAAVGRLDPAPAGLEELRTMKVPTREAVTAITEEEASLLQGRTSLADSRAQIAQARLDLDEQRDGLELAGTAPTVEELRDARAERDQCWAGLRGALEGQVGVEQGTADDYEQAVGKTDAVADARTAGAAQVERAAQVEARARRLGREEHNALEREGELDRARESLDREWEALWARSGVSVPTIREALAWLDARETAVGLAADSATAASRAEALHRQAATQAATLRAGLDEMGTRAAAGTLEELVELAEAALATAERRNSERGRGEAAVERSKRDLDVARRELNDAREAWEMWETAWPERRQKGGLPDGATPEAAHEIVRAVTEALGHIDRISDLRRRIEGIDRDREAYASFIAEVCAAVAPDLSQQPAERAAAALMTRLTSAEGDRTRREGLVRSLRKAEEEAEAAEAAVRDADEELHRLLVGAGCSELSELPVVERRAARARELRAELGEASRQVAQIGEGRFDQLAADVAGFDRTAADLRLAELRERIDELGEERDDQKEEIGERRQRLADLEGDVTPVEAAEDVELAHARVRELARQHAVAALSSAVVRRAMERYRRLHQDPLLGRANELFARFTLGSFVELFVDHDERDGAILVGRQRDRVLKRVHEMSSGTREQLFLALRIAAIERYVATSGPIPVVFDDVFLESDEPRSERIFEALGELARTTQVIVLTHHHHLVALGQRVLSDRLAVHRLPDMAPVLRKADGPGSDQTAVAA